jgi:hypothetical protein
MTEIDGLQNIIGNAENLHGIEAPPRRGAFATDEEYERAHDEWWWRVNGWAAAKRTGQEP